MTVRNATHDLTQPREGQKLALGSVAADLGVTFADLGQAAGISKTALFEIAASNRWPKNTPRAGIETAVRSLLETRGATPEQLEQLFWGHSVRRKTPSKTDGYGRLPDESPQKATDMLLAKQSLSYEAQTHFEMFVNPFDGEVTTADELYANGELRYVREAMWQCGKAGRFVAVVGESGAGKTTLMGDLKDRILKDRAQMLCVSPRSVISMTETESAGRTLKAGDIITAIIMAIDPHVTIPITHEARTARMLALVEESAKIGNGHLLVLEEAHKLAVPTIQALKRLHEACRIGRRPALGILLLGQPELYSKLSERRADLREVVQRCEVVSLRPLDADLGNYLAHRAKVAGKRLADLIDDQGVEALRKRLTVVGQDRNTAPISLVYPLAINNLMTAALNMAAELGAPLVTADVVRAI